MPQTKRRQTVFKVFRRISFPAPLRTQGGAQRVKHREPAPPDNDRLPLAALLAQVRLPGQHVFLFRRVRVAQLVPAVQTKFRHRLTPPLLHYKTYCILQCIFTAGAIINYLQYKRNAKYIAGGRLYGTL